MKAIIGILFCLSVSAADNDAIRVVTTTTTNVQPSYVLTEEVFTRGGQTNLIRRTRIKDGSVLFRAHTFYHEGSEMGQYIYNGAETVIGSAPGAPYCLTYRFDSSNALRSAIIAAIHTNATSNSIKIVTLDSFGFSNGVFYPRDGFWLRDVNTNTTVFPLR